MGAETPAELDRAIADAAKGGANALFILTDAFFNSRIPQIAQAAIKNRLPRCTIEPSLSRRED